MYKKHSSFSFIVLLFMPRLSEHEQSGAIGSGVRFSDIRYHNCHPSTIQRLRDCYQANGTVKEQHRSGQPRMATNVNRQLTSLCIDDIYIDDIRCSWLLSVPDK